MFEELHIFKTWFVWNCAKFERKEPLDKVENQTPEVGLQADMIPMISAREIPHGH